MTVYSLTPPANLFGGLGQQLAGMPGGQQMVPNVMQANTLSSLLAPQGGLGLNGTGMVPGLGSQLAAMPNQLAPDMFNVNNTGGFFGNGMGLGMNMPTLQAGLGGLNALGSLAMGFKSYGLMKDQHKLTKEVTNTNLNNSITAANGALEDRLRTRAQMNGDTDEQWKAEYEERKFKRG